MMLDRLRVSGRRETHMPAEGSAWGTMLFFPGVFLWLELVLRLAAGHSLRYLPISAAFALAAGLVCGAGLELFPGKWRRRIACVLAGLLGLIYGGELVCKTVMQSFYPLFSMADTAVNNDLMDYWGATWRGIWQSLPILVLMLFRRSWRRSSACGCSPMGSGRPAGRRDCCAARRRSICWGWGPCICPGGGT